MAKKRLNKKLVTILVLILIPVVVIGIILGTRYSFRDAMPFYEDALKLIEQADMAAEANAKKSAEVSDPQEAYQLLTSLNAETVDKLRKQAIENLKLAYKYSNDDPELRRLSAFKQTDVYLQQGQWPEARNIWRILYELDPSDVEPKRKLVEFYYEAAKVSSKYSRGDISIWKEVRRQSEMLISLQPEDVFGYLAGAHANIELVRMGAEEDAEKWIGQTQELLAKVEQLDPTHVELHHLQGQLALLKATRSELEADQALYKQEAEAHFRQAITDQPDNPQGYITFCNQWLLPAVRKKILTARSEPLGKRREQLLAEADGFYDQSLGEIEGMIERFTDQGEFYIAKSSLMEMRYQRITEINYGAIIGLCREALERDADHVVWTYILAQVYQSRSLLSETVRSDLDNAYGLLRRGLYLPGLLAFKGPRDLEVRHLRLRILNLLVDVSTSLALQEEDEKAKVRFLEVAESCLSELREHVSAESPYSLQALGSVALVRGEREEALKNYYYADEEFKTLGIEDSQLKVKLFRILRDSQYVSLAVEYGIEAIKVGMQFPRQFIEVMDALHTLPDRYSVAGMLELVGTYEALFGLEDSNHSKVLRYKAEALFRSGDREQAIAILDGLERGGYELKLLRAKMEVDQAKRIDALEQLAAQKPGDDYVVGSLYNYYLEAGKQDKRYIERGRALVKSALETRPDHVSFKQMQEVFACAKPSELSQDELQAILLKVATGISDPFTRESRLGRFYQERAVSKEKADNPEQARENWKESETHYLNAAKLKEDDLVVQVGAFRAMLKLEEWTQAQDLIGKINDRNAMMAMGLEGDLELAREQWNEAANTLEQLLKERPISLAARLNLSLAYSQLDRGDDALREALRASDLDRTSGEANRLVAILQHQVSQQQGSDQLSASQVSEIIGRLDIALQSGSGDNSVLQLRVIYDSLMMTHLSNQLTTGQGLDLSERSRITGDIDNLYRRSVAVCEHLISQAPDNVDHRRLLVSLHYVYSQIVDDEAKRSSLLELVDQVYQEGIRANPTSAAMTEEYSNYLRESGRGEDAEKALLAMVSQLTGQERQEAYLQLSRHYIRQKDYPATESVLNGILKEAPGHHGASFLLAQTYFMQAKLSEADALYHRLRKDQDTEPLMVSHAEVLVNMGRIEESQVLLSRARQDYPDSVLVMLVEIKQAMAKLDYEGAVDLADKVIERFTDNKRVYILKAQALSYDQRFQQSIECLQRLRGMVAPRDPLGRNLLWQVYWAAGRFGEAITEMKAMLRADPKQPQIRQLLMQRLSDRERWNELGQLYEESIRLYPDSIEMHLEAANSLMRHGNRLMEKADRQGASQKYARAKTLLERALALSQNQGRLKDRVTDGFVRYMLKTNQNQQVLELVDPVLADRTNPYTLLLYKAQALHQMGRDDDALSAFGQALEVSSGNMQTTRIVLDAVDRVATREGMTAWTREKLKSRSDWVSLHELLARLYRDQGDNSKAIESLLEAVRTAKDPARANRNRYQLANIYLIQGQRDLAIKLYHQVLDHDPDHVDALNNLAYLLMEVEGAENKAMAMAERAYKQARTNPNVMDTYAVVLLRKGDYEQAVSIIRQAISMSQRLDREVISEYYYHLAQGLVGSGQTDLARRQVQNALSQLEEGHVTSDKKELRSQIESLMSRLNN